MSIRLRLFLILLVFAFLPGCRGGRTPLPVSQVTGTAALVTVAPSATPVPPSATLTLSAPGVKTLRPTNTRPPTRTPMPTPVEDQRATLEPTFTPGPTRTPTHTSTLSPTPLPEFSFLPPPGNSPGLTITPAFFPRVERTGWELPTPIAGPVGGQAYRLKDLSEADAIELLRQLSDYAHLADIPTAGDFHADFARAQLAVNLAASETLLRFPDLPEKEQTRWLLAYSDTLLNADASHGWLSFDELLSSAPLDEWLAAEIERRLNLGWLDPWDLAGGLKPLGFVAQPATFASHEYEDFTLVLLPVYNLFGDGLPAFLWLIGNPDGSADPEGLYVAVTQQQDGRFQVVPLHGVWQFPYAGGTKVDALDLTGDGQPEVVIYLYNGEGGYKSIRTLIYQWRGDRFVEILHGNLDSNYVLVFPDDGWEFVTPADNGTVDIQIVPGGIPEPLYYGLLHWNGEWMEIARRWLELPSEPAQMSNLFNGYAMEFGQTAELAGLLQAILERPPENPDPSFADLRRFQLAVAAAQMLQVKDAQEILQSIIADPADPNYPLISKAAAAFLENYQRDVDAYRSCQAALMEMYAPVLSVLKSNPGADLSEITRDAWGYSTTYVVLCNLRPAFRLLISNSALKPDSDVPSILGQAGVSIPYSAHQDLDGDGRLDWLLLTDARGTGYGVDAWVLLGSQDGYQAVPVFEYDLPWLEEEFRYADSTARLETLSLPGSSQPAQVLQIGRNLWVWRIHRKDQVAEVETLLDLSNRSLYYVDPYVDRFEIHPQEAEVWVFNNTYSERPAWSVYAWQEKAGGFTHIHPLERLIFELGRPQEAIPAIQAELTLLNKDPSDYDYPTLAARLTYLLGLSYELSGDSDSAVRSYLDVWRQFPETGFALLAQAKLEER